MNIKCLPIFGIYLLLICLLVVACDNGTELERLKYSEKEGDARSTKKKKKSVGADSKGSKEKKSSSSADKQKNSDDSEDSEDSEDGLSEISEIEYPQLSFTGTGYTTYKLDDKFKMTMDLETQLDDAQLSINTTTAKVECGDKGGCDQKDVDQKVNSNSLGANIYRRISKSETSDLRKEDYKLPAYAILSSKAVSKNGITFTFDKPIPVYPWPGSFSRYEELENSPGTWTVNATADQFVPNNPDVSINEAKNNGASLEQSGKAIKQFSVTVTVTKVSSSNDEIILRIETTIPADKKRVLYENFPLPRSSEYKIDTVSKNIVEVFTTSWSNGDKSKDPEESVLTYKICASKTKEETKQFSCR